MRANGGKEPEVMGVDLKTWDGKDVHLENDGEVVTTFYIYIFVEARLGEGAPESENSVDVFDEAIADGIAAIEAAAEEAAGGRQRGRRLG